MGSLIIFYFPVWKHCFDNQPIELILSIEVILSMRLTSSVFWFCIHRIKYIHNADYTEIKEHLLLQLRFMICTEEIKIKIKIYALLGKKKILKTLLVKLKEVFHKKILTKGWALSRNNVFRFNIASRTWIVLAAACKSIAIECDW